jgi:hypothetical protein
VAIPSPGVLFVTMTSLRAVLPPANISHASATPVSRCDDFNDGAEIRGTRIVANLVAVVMGVLPRCQETAYLCLCIKSFPIGAGFNAGMSNVKLLAKSQSSDGNEKASN